MDFGCFLVSSALRTLCKAKSLIYYDTMVFFSPLLLGTSLCFRQAGTPQFLLCLAWLVPKRTWLASSKVRIPRVADFAATYVAEISTAVVIGASHVVASFRELGWRATFWTSLQKRTVVSRITIQPYDSLSVKHYCAWRDDSPDSLCHARGVPEGLHLLPFGRSDSCASPDLG